MEDENDGNRSDGCGKGGIMGFTKKSFLEYYAETNVDSWYQQ